MPRIEPMTPESEIIRAQIADVATILRNECWFEGERRGNPVDPRDEVVQKRVADIILSGVGAYLREKHGSHLNPD